MVRRPNILCLDFDGTIMRYEDPPEHFHPAVIAVLNDLREHGVRWIANSGRSFEGQAEIIRHCVEERGLRHWPAAIISNESYIHLRNGDDYKPWSEWNGQATEWARAVNRELQQSRREDLEALIDRHAPEGVYLREDGTVFKVNGVPEEREAFILDLQRLLESVPHADLINNGEWVVVIHKRLGKGNALRAWLMHAQVDADCVLAVGDHGNDLSMLDGTVTPHVACPGNAYPAVLEAVRRAGGYVAGTDGPEGTVEAFRHFFDHVNLGL